MLFHTKNSHTVPSALYSERKLELGVSDRGIGEVQDWNKLKVFKKSG